MGATELLSSYYAGELDRVELIYTSFVSMITSIPSVRTIVPLAPQGIEMAGDEIFKMTTKDGELSINKEKSAVAAAQCHLASLPQRPAAAHTAGVGGLGACFADE